VKQAAFATGYRQPSAFVEMFRRTFGATPKAWAAALGGGSAAGMKIANSVKTRAPRGIML
jgi:AraC-like DNA-binding protein